MSRKGWLKVPLYYNIKCHESGKLCLPHGVRISEAVEARVNLEHKYPLLHFGFVLAKGEVNENQGKDRNNKEKG